MTFRRYSSWWLAALLAITLAGVAAVLSSCATKPGYQPPKPPALPARTALIRATQVPAPKSIVLHWNYPIIETNTNLVFLLKGSTNLSVALTNWPVEKLVWATNWYSNGWTAPITNSSYVFSVTNLVVPGERYFYVTVSNQFWEIESDPSNVLALDPLPGTARDLRIEKGWQ